jgi:hypothetical protein
LNGSAKELEVCAIKITWTDVQNTAKYAFVSTNRVARQAIYVLT